MTLLALCCFGIHTSPADGSCAGAHQSHGNRKSIENEWARALTDPSEHRRDSFLYLVSSVPTEKTLERLTRERRQFESERGLPPLDLVDVVLNPRGITTLPRVSASLISNSQLMTLGPSGVILRPSEGHIVATLTSDSRTGGVRFATNEEIALQVASLPGPTLSPAELIARSSREVHNEVLLKPLSVAGGLEVTGFFFKTTEDRVPLISASVLHKLETASQTHGLPLIPIAGPSWRNDQTGGHNFPIAN